MFGTKTAIGIDISGGQINLALLKRDGKNLELLKAAACSVPDGAIKNGNVKDAMALTEAIKALKAEAKIYDHHTALSLVTNPVLIQILDMPKLPVNIEQFVRDEAKQYAILPIQDAVIDFCGIKSPTKPDQARALVVATERTKITETAEVLNKEGLNVESVEPACLAHIRAIYDKRIAGRFDCNVLVALVQSGSLTLCVFRNQALDLIRTKDISAETQQPQQLHRRVSEEIMAIIQYYQVEVLESSRKWQISVIAGESVRLPEDGEESMVPKLPGINLQVVTGEDVYQDTPVGPSSGDEEASPIAIGLAMKLLGVNESNLKINLLPAETARIKSVKKDVLIAANITAVILFLMIMAVGGLTLTTQRLKKNVAHKKQIQLLHDTASLLRKRELVDVQIGRLSDRLDRANSILSSRRSLDWAGILNGIRASTPNTVQITNLFRKDSSTMSLKGLAMSQQAVGLFVDMLSKSEHIVSASLVEAKKDNNTSGLVSYAIDCSLLPVKGE